MLGALNEIHEINLMLGSPFDGRKDEIHICGGEVFVQQKAIPREFQALPGVHHRGGTGTTGPAPKHGELLEHLEQTLVLGGLLHFFVKK